MTAEVKIYDRITPFNNVPVNTINAEFSRMWGDADVILVYKDGVFTGTAEPLGNRTVAEAEAQYTAMFEAQEATAQEAQNQVDMLEAVNAKLDFLIMEAM